MFISCLELIEYYVSEWIIHETTFELGKFAARRLWRRETYRPDKKLCNDYAIDNDQLRWSIEPIIKSN